MSDSQLNELTIEDILRKWPQTVEVFSYYSSSCIGCAIASFCRAEDAVKYYGLPEEEFIAALRNLIDDE